jgi:hypothetical protein
MLNSWAAGAFKPPTTVNQIYCTAGNWVKQAPKGGGRTASICVMIEEGAKHMAANKKKQQQKQAEIEVKSEQDESMEQKTPPKDRSNYKCWSCGEKGI